MIYMIDTLGMTVTLPHPETQPTYYCDKGRLDYDIV